MGLPLGISFYLMPCVGPRSFHPMSFFSLVQSRWSSHQFLVGSSDIYSPGSICAGTSLSGPFIMFPWVHILLRKHRNDSPLDETWPHFSVEFAFGSVLWWTKLPAVDLSCDPFGFLQIMGSASWKFSL